MIAGGSGDDASCTLFRAELRDEVDASTDFEGSHRLVVFVLAGLYTYQVSLFAGR